MVSVKMSSLELRSKIPKIDYFFLVVVDDGDDLNDINNYGMKMI